MAVVDRDHGWREEVARARRRARRRPHVAVGFLADKADDDGVPIAQIAAVHEFGAEMTITEAQARFMQAALGMKRSAGDTLVIPERSFFRTALNEVRSELADVTERVEFAVASGRMSQRAGLGILAETFMKRLKAKIASGEFEPLSEVTLEQRRRRSIGSTKPLVDTGQMLNAPDYEVFNA